MTYVIKLVEVVGSYTHGDPEAVRGSYVKSFDPDAHNGGGLVTWAKDLSDAKRFQKLGDAMEFYRQQSTVRPLRSDGKPNRPMTVFTVTFIPTED